MIEGLDQLFSENDELVGLAEMQHVVSDLMSNGNSPGRMIFQETLSCRAVRAVFETGGDRRSIIVKYLTPGIAERNDMVSNRWLPAVGLGRNGPRRLAAAPEPSGQCVWHIYEDFGKSLLDPQHADPAALRQAVDTVARVHASFASHPLLPECRWFGCDYGFRFYEDSIRDCIRVLQALRRSAKQRVSLEVIDSLYEILSKFRDQAPRRRELLSEHGGPDTLLHGDLWPSNTLVLANGDPPVRIIDWDHAGCGPVSYDMSNFLYQFPLQDRQWILQYYEQAMNGLGWSFRTDTDWNSLAETAEAARLANTMIWPAIEVLQTGAEWAMEELATVNQWFREMEPLFPNTKTHASF